MTLTETTNGVLVLHVYDGPVLRKQIEIGRNDYGGRIVMMEEISIGQGLKLKSRFGWTPTSRSTELLFSFSCDAFEGDDGLSVVDAWHNFLKNAGEYAAEKELI